MASSTSRTSSRSGEWRRRLFSRGATRGTPRDVPPLPAAAAEPPPPIGLYNGLQRLAYTARARRSALARRCSPGSRSTSPCSSPWLTALFGGYDSARARASRRARGARALHRRPRRPGALHPRALVDMVDGRQAAMSDARRGGRLTRRAAARGRPGSGCSAVRPAASRRSGLPGRDGCRQRARSSARCSGVRELAPSTRGAASRRRLDDFPRVLRSRRSVPLAPAGWALRGRRAGAAAAAARRSTTCTRMPRTRGARPPPLRRGVDGGRVVARRRA